MATVTSSASLVNRDRLLQSIEKLAEIGRLPQGGVRRLAYSPEDIAARQTVQQWMQEAGMTVRIDTAGNIIGRYEGNSPHLPVLATGSHLDTVPNGGRYDGALGVLAGIEVVRVLQESNTRLQHPLEVIIFTDEEGSVLGSKAITGNIINDSAYYCRPDGEDIQSCLQRIGGDWYHLHEARRSSQDIAAFLELHVEQGPILDSMGKDIGVVEGIVGQQRFMITIEGSVNHAGTTPMYLRQDALVAASQVVLAVHEVGNTPGQQVATVGQLQVYPNAVNVVPGKVEMSLDIRDLSSLHIERLLQQLEVQLQEIQEKTQTQISLTSRLQIAPALANDIIQSAIAATCEQLQFSYTHLPSRASHDAQEMANITDMGMIFVPSESGVSHSESEYTSPEDCAKGTTVLLHSLLKLDQYYLHREYT
ncbi:Zn-dependent hydrolase [Spirulina sp. CS-785/01]|uniref:Zn-dependent hydrolase n=1 Tax=Spirulina sp. CS-785/01 TaxID=3021716 RepID=UPI00232AFD26|nr:Zn-dependent hydrolase [Spirulina sp. CS-785/01]MDB9313812.1 Zn-dependent hydrolase [Spirulina sp. CS-785/01]